jgi:hypothetical protein
MKVEEEFMDTPDLGLYQGANRIPINNTIGDLPESFSKLDIGFSF